MAKRKESQRLTLAVYLFLAALAIIFALLGIRYIQSDSPTRDLIINLSSEIAGVVIIFFIVNQLFLLNREGELVKQVESIKTGLESKFSPVVWEKIKGDKFKFDCYLSNARSVLLLGYNLADFLKEFKVQIAKSITTGTVVNILIVDFKSIAGDLLRNISNRKEWVDQDGERSLGQIALIRSLTKDTANPKGRLNVKLIPWIPSCSMIIINFENGDGIAKITLQSPSINLPLDESIREHVNFVFQKEEHQKEFSYFQKNFELLWEEKNARVLPDESVT